MSEIDNKYYNKMENILQYIIKNLIKLDNEEELKTNPVLDYVVSNIIEKMKEVSPLFENLFEARYYGGSYYDGLKVGKPEEFDIDLKMTLPKLLGAKLEASPKVGFVRVCMPGWEMLEKSKEEYDKFRDLKNHKNSENYLLPKTILSWMESTVIQALNKYENNGGVCQMPYPGTGNIQVTMKKSGPAMTLTICLPELDINMDVDLVVSFKFTGPQWPPKPFKSLPTECEMKKEFLVVPKEPKGDIVDDPNRLWRLSFQEQEKVLMNGIDRFKPVLKLLKKLRDTQNHCKLSSYYIKTVFLNESKKKDKEFWNSSLSFVFMHMLKALRDCLDNHNIKYFWHEKNNLIKDVEKSTIENYKYKFIKIVNHIDKKINEDPYVVADFLLSPEERIQLNSANIAISKKVVKKDNVLETDTGIIKSINSNTSDSNNVDIASAILDIQRNMLKIQNHTELILQRLITVEETVQEIKCDNAMFKTELQSLKSCEIMNVIGNNGSTNKCEISCSSDDEPITILSTTRNSEIFLKQESESSHCEPSNINFIIRKMAALENSLQNIICENTTLKNGLRSFVLIE